MIIFAILGHFWPIITLIGVGAWMFFSLKGFTSGRPGTGDITAWLGGLLWFLGYGLEHFVLNRLDTKTKQWGLRVLIAIIQFGAAVILIWGGLYALLNEWLPNLIRSAARSLLPF